MDPIKSSHCHSFGANPIPPKTDISFAGLTVDAVGEVSRFLDTSSLINLWEVCIKSHQCYRFSDRIVSIIDRRLSLNSLREYENNDAVHRNFFEEYFISSSEIHKNQDIYEGSEQLEVESIEYIYKTGHLYLGKLNSGEFFITVPSICREQADLSPRFWECLHYPPYNGTYIANSYAEAAKLIETRRDCDDLRKFIYQILS